MTKSNIIKNFIIAAFAVSLSMSAGVSTISGVLWLVFGLALGVITDLDIKCEFKKKWPA
jgi:hypothetical protein